LASIDILLILKNLVGLALPVNTAGELGEGNLLQRRFLGLDLTPGR
jgi:hypothetical protein